MLCFSLFSCSYFSTSTLTKQKQKNGKNETKIGNCYFNITTGFINVLHLFLIKIFVQILVI